MHFHDPAVPLLGISPKEICTYSKTRNTEECLHQHNPLVSNGNYSNEQQQLRKHCMWFTHPWEYSVAKGTDTGKTDGAEEHDVEK